MMQFPQSQPGHNENPSDNHAAGISPCQRMQTVFAGKIPDRVPFFPTLYIDHACIACGNRFEDALVNPACGTECLLNAALKYHSDAVRFVMEPAAAWLDKKNVQATSQGLAQYDRRTGKLEGFFDVEGGGKFSPITPVAPVTTIQDVRNIEITAWQQYLEQGCLKHVQACVEKARAQGLFVVGMCPGQTINYMVEKLGNPETALTCFYDNPELALALINQGVAIALQKAKAFAEIGVDCIYIGDSYASASVISPSLYERFCAPAYHETAQAVHNLGLLCYKHCCGNYNPLLSALPATGIDAMDGIDPTSGMSVKHTKATIGCQITLMGGLSCLTLLQGTPDLVYREALQCVAEGKPGGRYVLGSACAVARHTPSANLLAAYQAVLDSGMY